MMNEETTACASCDKEELICDMLEGPSGDHFCDECMNIKH